MRQIYWDLEQGTEQWHRLRSGIITMSELHTVLVKGNGEGGFGAGAFTYMNQLIGERVTGEPSDLFQGNKHTERGHQDEPEAIELYTEARGIAPASIRKCGFITNHGVGYSPDSVVVSGEELVAPLEIKSKIPHKFIPVALDGKVPAEHYHQCQGGLWVSELEWIDFVCFSRGFPLFVRRLYANEKEHAQYAVRVRNFYELMEERIEKVLSVGEEH